MKLRIPNTLDRIQPSGTFILPVTAILVGAGTGLGTVLFVELNGQGMY